MNTRKATTKSSKKRYQDLGVTLLEALIVMSLIGISSGIAVSNLRKLNTASQNAAANVTSYVKQVRARAISSTLAYKIRPSTSTKLISETAANCNAVTWTADNRNSLKLPTGTSVVDTTWDICFNSRGFPDGNLDIKVRETNGTLRKVEIMLGGATRTT